MFLVFRIAINILINLFIAFYEYNKLPKTSINQFPNLQKYTTKMTEQNMKNNLSSSRSNDKTAITGLKEYLNASNQYEYTRKRLKIYQILQNRNQAKLHNHKMSLDKFQKIKIEKQQSSQQKNNFLKKKKILQSEQKIINKKNKEQRKNKINQLLKQIETQKIQDRNRIRQQSQNIAQKISLNRQIDLNIKREKRARVLELENNSKQNYKNFFIQKRQDLIRRDQSECQQYERREKQKRNQIQKINKLEMQILQKQNQTKNSYNAYRIKLSQIYGTTLKNTKSSFSMHTKNLSNLSQAQSIKVNPSLVQNNYQQNKQNKET